MNDGFIQFLAVLGGLSFLSTPIVVLLQRRKIKAEASKTGADAAAVLTESAISVLNEVRTEAKGLRAELGEARAEIRALRRHLTKVESILRVAGLEVPEFAWPPSNGTRGPT